MTKKELEDQNELLRKALDEISQVVSGVIYSSENGSMIVGKLIGSIRFWADYGLNGGLYRDLKE